MAHIFYKTDQLNISRKKSILLDAKERSTKWWVDILDCNKSFYRERIEMDFDDILKKLDAQSHFVFVVRDTPDKGKYIEAGFSTLFAPSYFLWIECSLDQLEFFEAKYKIAPKEWGAAI